MVRDGSAGRRHAATANRYFRLRCSAAGQLLFSCEVFPNSAGDGSKSRNDFARTLGGTSLAHDSCRRTYVKHPVTPDGRYTVARGRLWRVANPRLPKQEREFHVQALMSAWREVKAAMAARDQDRLAAARKSVNVAKMGSAVQCGGMMAPRTTTAAWEKYAVPGVVRTAYWAAGLTIRRGLRRQAARTGV